MPNLRGVTELNGTVNLITAVLPNGTPFSVTRAEAEAYRDAHPNFSDAQLEAQFVTLLQGRWTNRQDTVAIHLLSRTPLRVLIWVGDPPPAQWWL